MRSWRRAQERLMGVSLGGGSGIGESYKEA